METIKYLRKATKLTQQRLAQLAGINRAYLAQIEAGIHKPSPILEQWLKQVIMSYHFSQDSRRLILRLSERSDIPSEETMRVRAELAKLEEEGLGKLVRAQVVVWPLRNKSDWQIMSGLAALHLYRLFPRTFEMRFR